MLCKGTFNFIIFVLYVSSITSASFIDLLDKKIYITSAKHINYRLGEDLSAFGEDVFVSYNYQHFNLENKFIGTSVLELSDKQYRIKIGSYYLCIHGNKLVKCGTNEFYWNIKPKLYGYTIDNNGFCITIGDMLTVEKCGKYENQEFLFELRPLIYDCIDTLALQIEEKYSDDPKKNRKVIVDALRKYKIDADDNAIALLKKKLGNKKSFKKYLKNEVPQAIGKKKMEKLIKALHDKTWGWGWLRTMFEWIYNIFCPKD